MEACFQTFTPRHVKKRVGVINPSASKKKVRKTSCKNCSKTLFSKKEIWRHIRENEYAIQLKHFLFIVNSSKICVIIIGFAQNHTVKKK